MFLFCHYPFKINDEPLLKQEDILLKELGSSEKTSETLTRSTDHVFANYQTTSSQYNAVVGGLPTTCYPVCGVPTIRSDIPASRIRHIRDRTNYGDEASAYEVLFPSVFSRKGVYERDFLKTRPKTEIAQILRNIGMNISDEGFEEIWKQASFLNARSLDLGPKLMLSASVLFVVQSQWEYRIMLSLYLLVVLFQWIYMGNKTALGLPGSCSESPCFQQARRYPGGFASAWSGLHSPLLMLLRASGLVQIKKNLVA
ncbi:unnamed protein product [Bubo scandiacus]